MNAQEAKRFNPHPLYGFSAQYLVPSGQLSYIRGVVRCEKESIDASVMDLIKDNPRRKFMAKLKVYNFSLIPEGAAT